MKNSVKKVITYGFDPGSDYRLHSVEELNGVTRFCLTRNGKTLSLETPLIGRFNLYNVAAAVVLLDTLGIDANTVLRAVSDFRGIERRLSLISNVGNAPVYYDYAHHPSEIAAVITALKEKHGTLTVIFRPHTYSRTKSLWREFIAALSLADRVILLDIFPARERPIDGIDSMRLAGEIVGAIYSPTYEYAARLAAEQGMDAIALLGAGEVETVKNEFLKLGKNNG